MLLFFKVFHANHITGISQLYRIAQKLNVN